MLASMHALTHIHYYSSITYLQLIKQLKLQRTPNLTKQNISIFTKNTENNTTVLRIRMGLYNVQHEDHDRVHSLQRPIMINER